MNIKTLVEAGRKLVFKTGDILVKNGPHIFTGAAVAGVVGTVILAIHDYKDAQEVVDAEVNKRMNEATYGEDVTYPTKKEIVKLTWKCYIPTGLSAAATIGATIASDVINTKRLTALTAAYLAVEETLKDKEDDIRKLFGEKGAKEMEHAETERLIKKNDPFDDSIIPSCKRGPTPFIDGWSGQPFYHDIPAILNAKAEFNENLLREFELTQNDWFDILGLRHSENGDMFVYDADHPLRFHFDCDNLEDGRAATVLVYEGGGPRIKFRDY